MEFAHDFNQTSNQIFCQIGDSSHTKTWLPHGNSAFEFDCGKEKEIQVKIFLRNEHTAGSAWETIYESAIEVETLNQEACLELNHTTTVVAKLKLSLEPVSNFIIHNMTDTRNQVENNTDLTHNPVRRCINIICVIFGMIGFFLFLSFWIFFFSFFIAFYKFFQEPID
jgi:hypothetical protein